MGKQTRRPRAHYRPTDYRTTGAARPADELVPGRPDAIEHRCDSCGSNPGTPCTNAGRALTSKIHRARLDTAIRS